jgi:protein-S-isoprenylcysteine O-methyltransferase Ste14
MLGMLGMLLGSTLLAGGGRWIVSFPVFLVLLQFKIHIEERFMRAEFPDDYPGYRQRVPRLMPGLRLVSTRRVTSAQAAGESAR